ncbi:MAG TPA: glycerate kinase [Verrucomicrobiae bacterium]|nr:glycerate kinase [Verrucomicrobiae bacterium]
MSLKVLIVPDKFKGTLTAHEAAAAIAKGWRKGRPDDVLELLPMSDGGDGFGGVMSELLQARRQVVKTVDAAHRPCRAHWWWEAKSKTAIIESAGVVGLAQLPAKKFHPFELDTFGLGAVVRAAAKKGARRCLIGIGGSATNDGGFGVARALGWEFLDRTGNPIESWTQLHALAALRPPKRTRWFEEMIVAVDVQNCLLGAQGCTRVYGPQKGLTTKDFAVAERHLRRLAAVAEKHGRRDFASDPGAGAAGGLGFGLRFFLRARLQPGFDLFARKAELGQRLRTADLVITGEGAIDQSTLMGKGVGQIANWCRKLKIPCIGLAGTVLGRNEKCFVQSCGLTDLTTLVKAKGKPAFWLEKLAERVAGNWPV